MRDLSRDPVFNQKRPEEGLFIPNGGVAIMLRTCEKNHESIAYQGNLCPLCVAIDYLNAAKRSVEQSEARADKLQANVERMLGGSIRGGR